MGPEEFRKIILPEGRRLYAFAFRYLNNREDAEDIVQDVMTKLWESRDTLERYQNIQGLTTTMTRNMCIDRLRRNKKLRLEEAEPLEAAEVSVHGGSNFDDSREASVLVVKIIDRLGEPYKSAVILRDVEGYSYEEAAEVLGTNVNALRTTLSRARKYVREELEKIYSYGTGEDKRTAQKLL
jgi:RNA polymerase sigma-70 factor (ECF subfamily)